jgi:hypothetical protein
MTNLVRRLFPIRTGESPDLPTGFSSGWNVMPGHGEGWRWSAYYKGDREFGRAETKAEAELQARMALSRLEREAT